MAPLPHYSLFFIELHCYGPNTHDHLAKLVLQETDPNLIKKGKIQIINVHPHEDTFFELFHCISNKVDPFSGNVSEYQAASFLINKLFTKDIIIFGFNCANFSKIIRNIIFRNFLPLDFPSKQCKFVDILSILSVYRFLNIIQMETSDDIEKQWELFVKYTNYQEVDNRTKHNTSSKIIEMAKWLKQKNEKVFNYYTVNKSEDIKSSNFKKNLFLNLSHKNINNNKSPIFLPIKKINKTNYCFLNISDSLLDFNNIAKSLFLDKDYFANMYTHLSIIKKFPQVSILFDDEVLKSNLLFINKNKEKFEVIINKYIELLQMDREELEIEKQLYLSLSRSDHENTPQKISKTNSKLEEMYFKFRGRNYNFYLNHQEQQEWFDYIHKLKNNYREDFELALKKAFEVFSYDKKILQLLQKFM